MSTPLYSKLKYSVRNSTPDITERAAITNSASTFRTNGTQKRGASARIRNAKPKVDTGYHFGKLQEDLENVQKSFRFRGDEVFRRVKLSLVVSLITETLFLQSAPGPQTSLETANHEHTTGSHNKTARTVSDLFDEEITREVQPSYSDSFSRPYLLLDVRDEDGFRRGSIITAENYPKAKLAHGAHFESAALRYYKNREGCVIILYDYDETIAPLTATTLMERGYGNVFVLSGGLKVALQYFPLALLTSEPTAQSSPSVAEQLTLQLQEMSVKLWTKTS